MNFIPEQEPQQSAGGAPAGDEAPDLAGGDTTFVSGEGGEKKPPNKQAMALLGLVAVAGAVIWFVYFRGGPSAAAAAEQAGPDTVKTFLASGEEHMQLMRQMLQNTDKVVQQFRAYPSQTQVPLARLHTNPFRLLPPKAQARPENESESAMRRRREEERQAAVTAVAGLRLQSVLLGSHPACMIGGKMYQQGQEVDGFVVEQINPQSIIVRSGVYRFEVGMPQK
jgi:hypothetical protein